MKKRITDFVGTWKGDDLKDCLQLVYASRSKFYLGDDNMACNCTKIIEMQFENEKLIKAMEGVIAKLKEENEKLKAENEQLTGISGQLNHEIDKLKSYRNLYKAMVESLQAENAQLKANNVRLEEENLRNYENSNAYLEAKWKYIAKYQEARTEIEQLKAQLSPDVCSHCLKPNCLCHEQLQSSDKAPGVYVGAVYMGTICTLCGNEFKDFNHRCVS